MAIIKENFGEKKKDKYIFILLLCTFSLQNKTTFNFTVISLGGVWLNIFDMIIMLSMLTILFRFFYIKKRGLTITDWSMLALFIIFFAIGVANGNEIASILYNARSFLYLLIMFLITKNFNGNATFFYKLLSMGAFLCSTIYLYTFLGNSNFGTGNYLRLVDFNFQIVLLYLSFSIYYLNIRPLKIKYIYNIFYVLIVILTTQTRTLILPAIILCFLIILYGIYSKKTSLRIRILILSFLVLVTYLISFTNLNDLAFKRFNDLEKNEENTLDLRLNSALYNYDKMMPIEKLMGGGLGKEIYYYSNFNNSLKDTYTLELYLAEYVVKYGFLGTLLLNMLFLKIYLLNKRVLSKKFIIGSIIMLLSLSISGLSGYTGQFFLGVVLGMLANHRIWGIEPSRESLSPNNMYSA